MDKQEKIIQLVIEVLDLDEKKIMLEDGPHNIEEWDSVNNLRIYSHLEELFECELSFKEYLQCKTIKELGDLVK